MFSVFYVDYIYICEQKLINNGAVETVYPEIIESDFNDIYFSWDHSLEAMSVDSSGFSDINDF